MAPGREEAILNELLDKLEDCNREWKEADAVKADRKQAYMESSTYLKAQSSFESMQTYYLGDQRHYANSLLRGDHAYFFSEAQRMPPPKKPHAAQALFEMLPKETRRPKPKDTDRMPQELTNVYRKCTACRVACHQTPLCSNVSLLLCSGSCRQIFQEAVPRH